MRFVNGTYDKNFPCFAKLWKSSLPKQRIASAFEEIQMLGYKIELWS